MNIVFDTLEEKFIVSRWMYGQAEEIIDDSEYTILREYMLKHRILKEYTDRTWSEDPCPLGLLKKYGLERYADSVVLHSKSESIESIGNWNDVKIYYGAGEFYKPRFVTYKWDGWNIQVTYYNGEFVNIVPRGRDGGKLDVSSLSHRVPQKINYMGKKVIIFEFVLSDENFEELKRIHPKDLRSQRSAVRTAIANPQYHHLLTPIATGVMGESDYMKVAVMLNNCGFEWCIKPRRARSFGELVSVVKEMSDEANKYGYPTDGVVVVDKEMTDYRALRVERWEEKIHKSYVIGYELGDGVNSKSVKVKIRPVHLKNSTHVIVPVTNLKAVRDYRLFKGNPIAFRFKSASIAVFDKEATLILQKEYAGHFDEYRRDVDDVQLMKSLGY